MDMTKLFGVVMVVSLLLVVVMLVVVMLVVVIFSVTKSALVHCDLNISSPPIPAETFMS